MSFLFHAHSLALFDVGGGEMLLIFFVVLLLFGGKKMPEFARGLGKSIREFKKATAGVEDEIKRVMEEPLAEITAAPKKTLHTAPPATIEPAAPSAPTVATVATETPAATPPPPTPAPEKPSA